MLRLERDAQILAGRIITNTAHEELSSYFLILKHSSLNWANDRRILRLIVGRIELEIMNPAMYAGLLGMSKIKIVAIKSHFYSA